MNRIAGAIASVAMALSPLGLASTTQAADMIHIRGSVTAVDGSNVTIKTNDGKDLGLTLGDAWKIGGSRRPHWRTSSRARSSAPPIWKGRMATKPWKLSSFLRRFAAPARATTAGDLKPKSSMTNATVQQSVESVDGPTVTLKYKGGEKKVTIPPSTPIVTIVAAGPEDVKPGAKIFIAGKPGDDGAKLSGGQIVVGKDGITPPM